LGIFISDPFAGVFTRFRLKPLNIHMTTETKSKKSMPATRRKAPTRGGARVGSGRPRGSTTKIKIEDLMAQIELQSGESYDQLLARNYVGAIARSDWGGVRDYDKAFMNKMIADKSEVTTVESTEAIEQKQAAFADAIRQITGITAKD
jgi:hypothetical protein